MNHTEDSNETTAPHVVKEELLASGRWVKLEKTTYVDPAGSTRHDHLFLSLVCPAGVGIIALLKRTLHKDCVVMVKQFRPPMGCFTLEFPAGDQTFQKGIFMRVTQTVDSLRSSPCSSSETTGAEIVLRHGTELFQTILICTISSPKKQTIMTAF
uniref:Nudix (nucleoside diphosphate linked moiety X)-type motif 5 n=1 Tax=Hippocampus comes TaxID=109280 RepID=A0A3Q2XV78_HIPCM